ncbi:MAG: hypothetical protein PHW82_15280, partial [Bacteroidales bacterium]|nr:hypothetical protein [Bacteroidales bacterium]
EKDIAIRNLSTIEDITLNDTYSQHIEAIKLLTDMIIDKQSYEEKIEKCNEYLENVLQNIESHNKPENLVLNKFTDVHVKNYKTALKKFKEMLLL